MTEPTTPKPFLDLWKHNFATSLLNPSGADIIGAAMGGFSGIISPLSKAGLAAEEAEKAARAADLLVAGPGSVPGIGVGAAKAFAPLMATSWH